jgi:tripartite ATP-independent transporter DctM subunit
MQEVDTPIYAVAEDEAPANPRTAWLLRAEHWLGRALEIPAALLVIAEVIVISASVIWRYALNAPLIWSDELASVLLLWLVMFGTAIAHLRNQQMRVTTIVDWLPAHWRQHVDTFASMVVAVFLIVILLPAYEHFEGQVEVELAHLGIPDGVRVAALIFGVGIMSVMSALKLIGKSSPWGIIGSVLIMVVVMLILWLSKPLLVSMGNLNLTIFFILLLGGCIAVGVPIAFCFGIATLLYLTFMTRAPISIIISRMDEGTSHIVLLSIPLFIFLGLLIEMTGIARALVNCMATLLGHVRGGLSHVLIAAMYLVSGISGSKAADMAAIAPGLLPEMKKRGSDPGELAALMSATGAQTETVPPSLVLIMVGSAASVSIGALFTGGLVPAAVCGVALMIVAFFRSRHEDRSGVKRASARQMAWAILAALPALALPVLIRTAVTEGVATATEVATVGIVYALLVGPLVYRQFDWRRLYPILVTTASLSGAILIILGLAAAMAWALTQSGFSRQIVYAMTAMPGGATGFLAVSIVAFMILGSVLEGLPAILVFGPLLFPASRALGIHDVHYAMVIIISMGIGLFAPPFGVGYYAACAISGVHPDEAMKHIWPYLGAILAALILIAVFPWLSVGFL